MVLGGKPYDVDTVPGLPREPITLGTFVCCSSFVLSGRRTVRKETSCPYPLSGRAWSLSLPGLLAQARRIKTKHWLREKMRHDQANQELFDDERLVRTRCCHHVAINPWALIPFSCLELKDGTWCLAVQYNLMKSPQRLAKEGKVSQAVTKDLSSSSTMRAHIKAKDPKICCNHWPEEIKVSHKGSKS